MGKRRNLNQVRADQARAAVHRGIDAGTSAAMEYMLSNMMHLAHEENLDFQDLVDSARLVYEAERRDPKTNTLL